MANAYNVNDNIDEADANPDAQEASPQLILTAFMAMPNIVPQLTDEKLSEISHKVIEEYDIDKRSREEWETLIEAAMKLAMLVSEEKTYPWNGAANIKYPLLTVAALQFNARAYPAIVQGNRVVKCTTWGRDPQGQKAARGDRVSEFMSYQLLAQQPEWEEDTDRMLVILPIVGCAFRKVYYDPSVKRNVTRLVTADKFVVNYFARSLPDVPRTTEQMPLYPYEIQERIRSGRFIDFDYLGAPANTTEKPKAEQKASNDQDPDSPHLFLEQHRLLDLDEDGYTEPYIVTVHHSTQKVCRIVANFSEDTISFADDGSVAAVRKQQYYVKYQFMPSPDGGFYGMGFGWLTKDLSEAINTLNNQMLDAGHLSVVQGGLVSGQLGIKEKKITLAPGEWRVITTSVPMNQAVYPINYPGPSAVLFNLLGLMVDAGKDITGVKDVLTGEGMGKNASPTTTMALIEQGLQQFTAIYKRIHRSLKAELGILAGLNKKWVDPQVYAEFFDEPQQQIAAPGGAPDPQAMGAQQPQLPAGPPNTGPMQPGQPPMPGAQPAPMLALGAQQNNQPDPKKDFDETDMDILPISDPATVSKMQKLAKAEFIYQTAKENSRVDQGKALERMFEAADIDKVDELILPPQQPDPETVALTKRGAEAEVADLEAAVALKKAQEKAALADADLKEHQAGVAAEVATIKVHQDQQKVDDAAAFQSGQLALGADKNAIAQDANTIKADAVAAQRERDAQAHEVALKVANKPAQAAV